MSTLLELFEKVKDDQLPLPMIEKYRDEMVHLHSMMQLELAEIEKEGAIFAVSREDSVAATRRAWRGTEKGLRELVLNRYIKAIVKEIDSLKSRVYRLI